MPASSDAFFVRRRLSKISPSGSSEMPFARRKSAFSSGNARGVTALSSPIFSAGAKHDLALRLVPRDAARNELVDPEVLERNGDDPVQSFDPGDLERAHEDVAVAVLLRVDERVRNGHGNLVAELRRANRVAVDEQVRHGP